MNVEHGPTAMTERNERHSSVSLQGRWFLLARGLWFALVILTLAIFFVSLPLYAAQLQTVCTGPYGSACTYLQLSPEQRAVLKAFGLSPRDYAAYMVAVTLANMVVCLVVSTLIVWRRSHDRMALLVALALVMFGPIIATSTVSTSTVSTSSSPWQVPNECLYFLAGALFTLVFLLFPTGQFVPRWTLVVSLAVQVLSMHSPKLVRPTVHPINWPGTASTLASSS